MSSNANQNSSSHQFVMLPTTGPSQFIPTNGVPGQASFVPANIIPNGEPYPYFVFPSPVQSAQVPNFGFSDGYNTLPNNNYLVAPQYQNVVLPAYYLMVCFLNEDY